MLNIFLNYRRDDSVGWTGRISAELRKDFSVFRDVTSIPKGAGLVETIGHALTQSDVLVVVIGERWHIENDEGRPRIQDPSDYVAREIAMALKKKIPVLPVLIENAGMPTVAELPASLAALPNLNACRVRDEDFAQDIVELKTVLRNHESARSRNRRRKGTVLASLVLTIFLFLFLWVGALDFLMLHTYSRLATTVIGNVANPKDSYDNVKIVAFETEASPDREEIANKVLELSRLGAKVIGIDIDFTEDKGDGEVLVSAITEVESQTKVVIAVNPVTMANGKLATALLDDRGELKIDWGLDSLHTLHLFLDIRPSALLAVLPKDENLGAEEFSVTPSFALACVSAYWRKTQNLHRAMASYDDRHLLPKISIGSGDPFLPYKCIKVDTDEGEVKDAVAWLNLAPVPQMVPFESELVEENEWGPVFSGKIVLIGSHHAKDAHTVVCRGLERRYGVDIHGDMVGALLKATSPSKDRLLMRRPHWLESLAVILALCLSGALLGLHTLWWPKRKRRRMLAIPIICYVVWVTWAFNQQQILYGLFDGILVLLVTYWFVGHYFRKRHYESTHTDDLQSPVL